VAAHVPTVIPDPCAPEADTMCLGEGDRFKVEVTWKDYVGNVGTGKVAPAGTLDSGLFYFFTPNNWELLIKVLDGCGINQHFWTYFAATTDVEFEVTVTDSVTGAVRQWTNALGHPANAVNETAAFG
jgi:hypothetical protein